MSVTAHGCGAVWMMRNARGGAMETWMWLSVGAVLVVVAAVVASRPNPLKKAVDRARDTEDLTEIVTMIEAKSTAEQVTAWDQAISRLWRAYDRELAAKLIREAADRCDADIMSYWVRQVVEVEPEIARKAFNRPFLARYFDLPEPPPGAQPAKRGARKRKKR
ncbi:MAG: hypothetical protein AAFX99_07050 [Myxococcota bacterium]